MFFCSRTLALNNKVNNSLKSLGLHSPRTALTIPRKWVHKQKLTKANPRVGGGGCLELLLGKVVLFIIRGTCWKNVLNVIIYGQTKNEQVTRSYFCVFKSKIACLAEPDTERICMVVPLYDVIWVLFRKIYKWHLFIHLWTRQSQLLHQTPLSPWKKGFLSDDVSKVTKNC